MEIAMKQQGNPQQGGQWAEQAKEGLANQEKRQQRQSSGGGGQQGDSGSDTGEQQNQSSPQNPTPKE